MSVKLSTSSIANHSAVNSPLLSRELQVVLATYAVVCGSLEIERVAQEIAYEQTVEVSPSLISSKKILEEIVGKVEAIEPAPRGRSPISSASPMRRISREDNCLNFSIWSTATFR